MSCEEEAASIPVLSGTPAGGDGSIVGGTLTWERDGALVRMAMDLTTTGGEPLAVMVRSERGRVFVQLFGGELDSSSPRSSGLDRGSSSLPRTSAFVPLVQQVTTVYQQLPLGDGSAVMILASNYGEAGALDFYGHGLPPVVSPHLTYYYWAPAHMTPSTVIVVGYSRPYLGTFFGDIEQAATITNSYGLRNYEYGQAIWICRSPLVPLDQAWPRLKALD